MKLSSSAVKYPETILSVRTDYLIAIVPAILWCIYRFGINALMLMIVSSCTALVFEFIFKLAIYRKPSIPDAYSAYMGLIFSLTLYPETSLSFAAIGGALSVIIFRFIGSKGQCFIFAPFAARIIITAALPELLKKPANIAIEYLYTNTIPASSTYDFILGTVNKSIGSLSAIAVIVGALYLLLRKNTNRIAALSYIVSAFLLMFFFPLMEGRGMESAINEILSGDLLFVFAFVMTDFSWSPRFTFVKFLSGVVCAGLTFIFLRANMYNDAYYLSTVLAGFMAFVFDKLFFTFKFRNYKKGENSNADQ